MVRLGVFRLARPNPGLTMINYCCLHSVNEDFEPTLATIKRLGWPLMQSLIVLKAKVILIRLVA